MNYHPTNDFPINLDTLVKLVGFAHKKNAKRTLENNFIKDEDYKILLFPKGKQVLHGGHNEECIMLNIDTFKNMCMMVKTAFHSIDFIANITLTNIIDVIKLGIIVRNGKAT